MNQHRKRSHLVRHCFSRDRDGAATVEMALVLPAFLTLLLLVIEIGIYFTVQSSLDAGVLTTAEALRTAMMASSSYAPPSAATLKTTISTNGGTVLQVSGLAVDVQLLSILSSGVVAIADGTANWGGNGSVVVMRAQATMPLWVGTTSLTLTSTAMIRRKLP